MRELIERLHQDSPVFAKLWTDHEVLDKSPIRVELFDPERKTRKVYERLVLNPAENPKYHIMVLVALD